MESPLGEVEDLDLCEDWNCSLPVGCPAAGAVDLLAVRLFHPVGRDVLQHRRETPAGKAARWRWALWKAEALREAWVDSGRTTNLRKPENSFLVSS